MTNLAFRAEAGAPDAAGTDHVIPPQRDALVREEMMPRDGSFAVSPDTKAMNFFQADQGLVDLLKLYLDPALQAHVEPHLDRLGWLAANEMDDLAHSADRHPPELHHRTKAGKDEQRIEYHPAYRDMERLVFGEYGVHAMAYRPDVLGWNAPLPPIVKYAATYLFGQADYGLTCPVTVTDTAAYLLKRHGSKELQDRFLPGLLSTDPASLTQAGIFMVEKEGGTDIARFTTVARHDGDGWRLYGDKWFCSNADASLVITLARVEDESGQSEPGWQGLTMFLVPRDLDDGSRNRYRIVRLKDKLGTRSMASGEVRLEGAVAYPIGPLGRGFAQMTDQVNMSRLSNGVRSSSLMRRSVHEALVTAKGRRVSGKAVIEYPLARKQLLKMMLPAEQALSLWMYAADTMAKADPVLTSEPSADKAAVLRLLMPLIKFRATRDTRKVCGDSLEMRGGIGYVEDWINSRLVRDSFVGSIWEGASSVVALDAIGRTVRRSNCEEILGAELHRRLDEAEGVPSAFIEYVRANVDRAITFVRDLAHSPSDEADYRRSTSLLYHVTTAALMTWEAARIEALRGDGRRLLLAHLVLEHRVKAQDPFAPSNNARESRIADALLSDLPMPLAQAAQLVAVG